MSPTNLAEYRDAIRIRLGSPTADSFNDDVSLTDIVNEAGKVFGSDVDDAGWLTAKTTFSTAAGTQEYTPPGDWARTRLLTIDGEPEIEWRPLSQIREWPTDIRGIPRYYTIYGDVLMLAPIPDGAYTIRHDYFVDELTLASDTDTFLLPTAFDYAVVAYGAHVAHLRNGNADRANIALAEYQGWLRRIMNQKRRSVKGPRVRVRMGRDI